MREHAMIDTETLGTDPGCVVLSIGACRFDPVEGVDQRDTYYAEIDRASALDAGLEIDGDTLEWWYDKPADLRPFGGDTPLSAALLDLSEFLDGAAKYWANSPAFDLAILEDAYAAVDLAPPWRYWEWRDVRTVRDLPGAAELPHTGREHHALDDAIHQAREVRTTLDRLKEGDPWN